MFVDMLRGLCGVVLVKPGRWLRKKIIGADWDAAFHEISKTDRIMTTMNATDILAAAKRGDAVKAPTVQHTEYGSLFLIWDHGNGRTSEIEITPTKFAGFVTLPWGEVKTFDKPMSPSLFSLKEGELASFTDYINRAHLPPELRFKWDLTPEQYEDAKHRIEEETNRSEGKFE